MPIPGKKSDIAERRPSGAPAPRSIVPRVRSWLRALHRDAGYLAVGLTIVYALSGLAVNHVSAWDPNFKSYETVHQLGPVAGDDVAATQKVLGALGIKDKPRDVYRAAPTQLEITFDRRSLHVDTASGRVVDEGQKPRFLLRVANWLHLNRGKKAWSYIADGYALFLLFLAGSGIFMLPGKKGIKGRGGLLVALGAAVPILYVSLSGGP
jgi:uncharacterized protein